MARRRRKGKAGKWVAAAVERTCSQCPRSIWWLRLVGSLIPVNRGWTEPAEGTTIYLADNGIHADIIMPVKAHGLDWSPVAPQERIRGARLPSGWIAFGAGEQRVYLDTPTWRDITPRTIWSALAGGKRVMHVEYVPSPDYAVRADPASARGISPLVGSDPRGVRARRGGRSAFDSPRLRPLRRLLSRRRQGERDQHLQQLGRATDSGWRGSRPACGRRSSTGWSGATGRPLRARSG